MKKAIIDIGSNSIRLTLYSIEKNKVFKILFREKIMAGLAGYVEDGALTQDGIYRAIEALNEFRETLNALDIHEASVFATASLRNITNTEEALKVIQKKAKYSIEVLSGDEEARLGYYGAAQELKIKKGAFVDIGGASTEIVSFKDGKIIDSNSFSIGSLSLYHKCVKKILPGKKSFEDIENTISKQIDKKKHFKDTKYTTLICVGGTSRAILKLAKKYFDLPSDCNRVTAAQLNELVTVLCKEDSQAIDLILKNVSDRVHTIIPGLLILSHIFNRFSAKELYVSNYGVREGYLCYKQQTNDTGTRKTEK